MSAAGAWMDQRSTMSNLSVWCATTRPALAAPTSNEPLSGKHITMIAMVSIVLYPLSCESDQHFLTICSVTLTSIPSCFLLISCSFGPAFLISHYSKAGHGYQHSRVHFHFLRYFWDLWLFPLHTVFVFLFHFAFGSVFLIGSA